MEKNKLLPIQFIKEVLEELLGLLKVEASFEVAEEKTEEGQPLFKVNLQGDDLGILIGWHGETLAALQHFVVLSLHRQFGEWFQVVLDIGGYRKEQEERLKIIAKKARCCYNCCSPRSY